MLNVKLTIVRPEKFGKLSASKRGLRLEEINVREGYIIRFTGPWAPFSFVTFKEDHRNFIPIKPT